MSGGYGGFCHFFKLVFQDYHHFNNLCFKGTKVSDFQKYPYFTLFFYLFIYFPVFFLNYFILFYSFIFCIEVYLTDIQWRSNTLEVERRSKSTSVGSLFDLHGGQNRPLMEVEIDLHWRSMKKKMKKIWKIFFPRLFIFFQDFSCIFRDF